MYDYFSDFLSDKKSICIIQAENPDGDSLGSALALESLLEDRKSHFFAQSTSRSIFIILMVGLAL